MKQLLRTAVKATLPVMAGYLVLGFGFGIILQSSGYGWRMALAMSGLIYAGSMQYVGVGLMTGGASLVTVALTTLMVNARHILYGISMLDRYKDAGRMKPYLIFALTDETYSLVCTDSPEVAEPDRLRYSLLVSLLDHLYWISGSLLGVIAGEILRFNTQGIDFALTALFLTVFTEQWLSTKRHGPALIGVGASAACLLIFGSEHFLIPTMLVIALLLCLYRGEENHD